MEEPLYEHRRMISPSSVVLTIAVLVPGMWVYGTDVVGWVQAWPVHLVLFALPAWHWFMVGRHVNRHVRVDRRGLWVDGALVARPNHIVGLGITVDRFWSFHLKEIKRLTDGRLTVRGGILNQKAWVNVITSPGFEHSAAVTRQKDLARGSWWSGVIVQTKQRLHPGHREAWLIGSHRSQDLFDALFAIAPNARLPQPPQGRPPEPDELQRA